MRSCRQSQPNFAQHLAEIQFFDGLLLIGVYADITRDREAFFNNLPRVQLGVVKQRPRGGEGIGAAGPNSHNGVIGFNDISVAGHDEGSLLIGNHQQRFQAPQGPFRPPELGKFYCGSGQLAMVFF